eukprot:gnl/MRDRNA2_/MRDRNA2_27971_c0_seq1.p1 gnl/MRDRNA2_/MRDRNA2_27971_c0~~gnl/MRDRNA2_/MRDRNA2_27971_c0_seq1.p1  ORF type:complete len:445 (-),score=52.20 gnl/MRDRNA2_/MRDRNA2_27971_c0_seq1:35-1210(-)
MSSAAPRAVCGAASICNVGKGGENQDSFVTTANPSGSKAFVGVFDGHGERGHHLSQFARSALTMNLFNDGNLHSNPKAAFDNAYRATQEQIIGHHGREHAGDSGTTAIAAYKNRNNLFVANVGDSRAVLGRCQTATSSASRGGNKGGKLVAVELSSDQKPCRPDEKKRILEQGGRVHQGMFPVQTPLGGCRFIPMGPERVIDRTGISGLAMSRALGDLNMHPYVSSRPELCEKRLDKKDKVVILGSDGVWDHVSSQEAVDIASRHADAAAAARDITNIARQRWVQETQGALTDDITAVVMRLDHPDSSASSSGATRTEHARQSSSQSDRGTKASGQHRSHRHHGSKGRGHSTRMEPVPERAQTVPCIVAPRRGYQQTDHQYLPPAGIPTIR